MGTSVSLKKKVYLCYSYSNSMYINSLCEKINKEGFQTITDGTELMPGEMILSVSESIKKCDYFVLIISDEFGEHMREEYHTALIYGMDVMVFIKSELYREEGINNEFKDRLVTLWDNETELSMKVIATMEGVRYKYPVRGYQLEALVEDLFKFYGCDTKKTAYTQESNYDIYAEKNGKKFFIEVKAVRSKIISKSSIANTTVVADLMSLKDDEYFVLVTANMIPDLIKEYIRTKDKFLVIDISELLYLVQDNEELKYRLLSLVEFTTEDIELKEPEEFLRLLDVVEDETLDSLIDDNEKIKQLLQEVKDWEQDKKTSTEYEKFCTKVLKILFSNDLTLWREQQKSNDDLYRFDLICKIKDDVTSAFWKFIEEYFRSKYIIFEFKNYKDVITQKEIYTTEKYLYAKALRCVAIIVSCNGSETAQLKEREAALRREAQLEKEYADALEKEVSLDPLTQIGNRHSFNENLDKLLKTDSEFVFCFCDLDHLKYVNDTFGHAEGDRYLCRFTELVKLHLRVSDFFARVGGDEFCILLKNCPLALAQRELTDIQESFLEDSSPQYPQNFSFGLFHLPKGHGVVDPAELLHQADVSMYEQKKLHKQQ